MFHKLKIKNIRPETADCVSISFDVPTEISADFQYKAGQFLTFRTQIEGEEVRRSYSICSSPLENELRVAVKKAHLGKFSNYVHESLKEGDLLEAMLPTGRFIVNTDAQNAKKYVGIAAGSGITPILSILKTVLNTEPNSHFTLIYGNKRRNTIIFKEAIDALKNKFMNRLSVYHILSQEVTDAPILRGRIDAEKLGYFLKHLIDSTTVDDFFICGPEDMTHEIKETLLTAGVDNQKIHFELFAAIKPLKSTINTTETLEKDEQCQVTIRLDGSAITMPLSYHGESILEEALKNGADLPYACKGGVCCTCKAKLVEGEVEMIVHYGLEAEEIATGFILTCQSHPRTSKVVVDFDLK